MKHRTFGLLMALFLLLGMIPGNVSAAQFQPLPQVVTRPAMEAAQTSHTMAGGYTITMTAEGPGTAELYSTSAGARERIYFLADPQPGYRVSFEKCGYRKGQYEMELYYIGSNMYEIVMPDGDVVLDLEFVPIETKSHPVSVTVGEGGMVTVSQTEAKAGESIFLEIAALPGTRVVSVQASASGSEVKVYPVGRVKGAELYELFMPDAPLQISVVFTRNGPYSLYATVFSGCDEPGGSLKLSHTEAYEGDLISVTAVPDRGWEVCDVTTRHNLEMTQVGENTWTFVMPRHGEEVYASFSKILYPVTVAVEKPVGGTAVLDRNQASIGDAVTLTCTPDEGYRVARIEGVENLTDNGDGTYTFLMDNEPVALSVLFLRENNPFLDVNESHFYHDSVIWAVENGITNGVDALHFGPFGECNRAQVVTFLWRAAGSPVSTGENPFTDVEAGSWYADAVRWAVENGITNGLTETTFGPNESCNRAQVVTFLWRAMGSPASSGGHGFGDVASGSWYEQAVVWALEHGVTTGLAGSEFGPLGQCLRAQVVTFLYRAEGTKG